MSRIIAAKGAQSTERGTSIMKGTASSNKRTSRKTTIIGKKSITSDIARTVVGTQTRRKSRLSIAAASGRNVFIVRVINLRKNGVNRGILNRIRNRKETNAITGARRNLSRLLHL